MTPTYCLGIHGRHRCELASTCAKWVAFQADRHTPKEPLGKDGPVTTLCKRGQFDQWVQA